jgi:hypothetical protein
LSIQESSSSREVKYGASSPTKFKEWPAPTRGIAMITISEGVINQSHFPSSAQTNSKTCHPGRAQSSRGGGYESAGIQRSGLGESRTSIPVALGLHFPTMELRSKSDTSIMITFPRDYIDYIEYNRVCIVLVVLSSSGIETQEGQCGLGGSPNTRSASASRIRPLNNGAPIISHSSSVLRFRPSSAWN